MRLAPLISTGYALALDTTNATLRLGLSNFGDVNRYQAWELGRALSTQLHTHLADFIAPQAWTDLTWIAVARGPGSFTGTRIGIVTAKTLAQQLQIPLFSISTLAMYAWARWQSDDAPMATDPVTIAADMLGQRDQVYGGIYQVTAQACKTLICDRQYPTPRWQHLCRQYPQAQALSTHRVLLPSDALQQALLVLGQQQWLQGKRPPWHAAHPYYPSDP